MTDVFSKKQRSEIMSRVKGRGNRLTVLSQLDLFRVHGFIGWRRNAQVFGKPDLSSSKHGLRYSSMGVFGTAVQPTVLSPPRTWSLGQAARSPCARVEEAGAGPRFGYCSTSSVIDPILFSVGWSVCWIDPRAGAP